METSAQEGSLHLAKTKMPQPKMRNQIFGSHFWGYPRFTFQPLNLFRSPSNDFQKSSPSQPGQSTEPDPHEHHAARQLGARVPSALAGAARC